MMHNKKWSKFVFGGAFLAAFLIPALAFAAEGEAAASAEGIGVAGKAIGAALAMGVSAIGAGWAQAKIGSAGQATLAERPEERIWVITLTALPEIIVLLGFVMAILIAGGE